MPPPTEPRDGALPHVLVVEDSALVVAAMRVLFEETGHRVSAAVSAASAVEAIVAEFPDIVLLDLGLPDADGMTVLEEVRARLGRIPATIALTGDADESTVRRCVAGGCALVLLKPVAPRELIGKVLEVLGRR